MLEKRHTADYTTFRYVQLLQERVVVHIGIEIAFSMPKTNGRKHDDTDEMIKKETKESKGTIDLNNIG